MAGGIYNGTHVSFTIDRATLRVTNRLQGWCGVSKRKRVARKQLNDIARSIHHTLRTHFGCTEQEIHLIDQALQHLVPPDVAQRMQDIGDGKVTLSHETHFVIDMGDGTQQEFSLANHPIILLHDYLVNEKYDLGFGTLYWNACTSANASDFYKTLTFLSQAPYFAEERTQMLNRASRGSEVES